MTDADAAPLPRAICSSCATAVFILRGLRAPARWPVQVSSRLAAPITPGKPAEITVDAFPSNDFGTLKGEVESISPTTSTPDAKGQAPAYMARIRIPPAGIPARFPAESLRSGMGITARVVLEEKPMISLVFDFVNDLFKPMTERR